MAKHFMFISGLVRTICDKFLNFDEVEDKKWEGLRDMSSLLGVTLTLSNKLISSSDSMC